MKRNLGKVILLTVLFPLLGWGVNYQWQLIKSPHTLRVGQSALAQYECRFEGSAAEYSVKLNLKDNPDYTIRLLSEHDRIVKGNRINTFDIVVTPKKSGHIDINPAGIVEYVPPGAIDYNAHLGRDNISKSDIVVTKTILPPFGFDVQPNNSALTGNITMDVHVDRMSVRAHEPLHLSLIIKGSGNLEQYVPYELSISGVKVFSEPPQKHFTPSIDGVEGEIRQEFALVAEKSYMIPSIRLSLFDTVHNRFKVLQSAPVSVEVGEGYDPLSLLDAPDLSDTAALKRYAFYGALIVSGAFLGEAGRVLWKRLPRRKSEKFWEKTKSKKELVLILALSGDKRYEAIIAALESDSISLSEAKKKLSTLTTDKEEIA